MDTLLVVLFVLVIFSIFICLENNGFLKNKSQLIEGMTPTPDELLEEARLLSSQGVCTDPLGAPIWPRDESTCTGLTGFELEFLDVTTKKNQLTGISTPDNVIERELSLKYGDIVKVDGNPTDSRYQYENDSFIYRGVNTVNLETHTDQIALFPYKEIINNEEKLEYCYNDSGLVDANTKASCQSAPHNGTFLTPVLEPGLDLSAVNDDFKSISCQDIGDNKFATVGGVPCFSADKIKPSHCVSYDGTNDTGERQVFQIKPTSFWKSNYILGSNTPIDDLCIGVPSDNTWNYNSNLNTMMDSQQFAELLTQVESTVDQGLNSEFESYFTTSQADNINRVLPANQAALQAQQLQARTDYLNTTCSFEGESLTPPIPYHGNIARNTAKLYVCADGDSLNATKISENCSQGQLSCDPQFAKDDPSVLIKHVQCSNGNFTYTGCLADTCILPADFDVKYQIIDNNTGKQAGDSVTINDLKNMVDDTLNVRCKQGYSGTPNITSCRETGTGELVIDGCTENLCSIGDTSGYNIPNQSSQSESLSSLYNNNNMDSSYTVVTDSTNPLPFLKCDSPNYYHLLNPGDAGYNEFMLDVTNGENLKDHAMYPKATCNVSSGQNITSDFTFSGCYPNQCQNPSRVDQNKFYDGTSSKPEHMEDTRSTKQTGTHKYVQYQYDNISSSNDNINITEIQNKIKCGINYTKEGESGSTDNDDKEVPPEKIKCYNFFDFNTLSDTSDQYAPTYSKKLPDGSFSTPPTFSEFHSNWIANNTDIPNVGSRILPFSVSGCLENYCTWPKVDSTTPGHEVPRVRDQVNSGLSDDELGLLQQNGQRFQLGYQYDSTTSSTIDYTPVLPKTARDWVDYNESTDTVNLKCVGESDNICEEEPIFTIAEITEMVQNVPPEINSKGNSLPGEVALSMDPAELSSVGRGGEFTISRCWNSVTPGEDPYVTCQGTDCTDINSSTCEASSSGCQQNKCTLSATNATVGTRILIETLDTNTGQVTFKSVGGTEQENMTESFNVDQIRNITCDYNHSKPVTGGAAGLYGGGTTMQNIKIECNSDGGNFIIENPCDTTVCGTQINKIDSLINLTSSGGDINSICPNQSWIDSHDSYYGSLSSPPISVPIVAPFPTDSIILGNGSCNDDSLTNDVLYDFNKSRYKDNGSGNYECYNQDTIPDTIAVNGMTSIGDVTESCNYDRDTFDTPRKTVSGCQPRLCTLPQLSDGYEYNSSLIVGNSYSTDSILNRDYYQGVKPAYLSQADYDTLTYNTDDLIKCAPGYHGTVSLSCSQTRDSTSPIELVLEGCTINQCTLPPTLDSNIDTSMLSVPLTGTMAVDTLNYTDPSIGIKCGNNTSYDPSTNITCDTHNGVFSGLDTMCTQNMCTYPTPIFPDLPDSNYDNRIRDITAIPEAELPSALQGTPGGPNPLKTLIHSYMVPPADHNICYENLPSNPGSHPVSDFSSVTCGENCTGVPVVECNTPNTDMDISGCKEKYCNLPAFTSLDNIKYNFGGITDKLELVSRMNGAGTAVGITPHQSDRVFSGENAVLSCSPFAQQDDPSVPPTMVCGDGSDFILSGCSDLTQPTENSSSGHIIYSYYPSGCPIAKDNAFIFLSGTSAPGQGGANISGESVTHSLDRTILSGVGEFYYYKNSETDPTNPPVNEYSSDEPDGWTQDGDNGWFKIEMVLNYSELGLDQINSRMQAFMDINKDMCDKISTCDGFNVSRFNRLTSEIDAIEKADARDPTNGTVDISILSSYLADSNNNILEYGTMKAEQKDIRCNSHIDATVIGFHNDWGANITTGGNSYVYNEYGTPTKDVLNHQVIPNNSSIYFKQLTLSDGSGDSNMGYTNVDEPDTTP